MNTIAAKYEIDINKIQIIEKKLNQVIWHCSCLPLSNNSHKLHNLTLLRNQISSFLHANDLDAVIRRFQVSYLVMHDEHARKSLTSGIVAVRLLKNDIARLVRQILTDDEHVLYDISVAQYQSMTSCFAEAIGYVFVLEQLAAQKRKLG